MSEYVDREKVLAYQNELEPCLCRNIETRKIFSATKDEDLVAYFENIPAADVRPVVRAEWYGEADGYADGELVYDMWSCPICGKRFEEWEEKPAWNFCPNCGADMRGGENDG